MYPAIDAPVSLKAIARLDVNNTESAVSTNGLAVNLVFAGIKIGDTSVAKEFVAFKVIEVCADVLP